MRIVDTRLGPRPTARHSQAIVHGDTVYAAGQPPIDPDVPDAPPGDAMGQTRDLDYGYFIEIQAVAALKENDS